MNSARRTSIILAAAAWLLSAAPETGATAQVNRLTWHPGDTWLFRWSDTDGNRSTLTRQLVRVAQLRGRPAYFSHVRTDWTNAIGDKFVRVVNETRALDWRLIAPLEDFLIPWSASLLKWPLVQGATWSAFIPAGPYRSGRAELRVGGELERTRAKVGQLMMRLELAEGLLEKRGFGEV